MAKIKLPTPAAKLSKPELPKLRTDQVAALSSENYELRAENEELKWKAQLFDSILGWIEKCKHKTELVEYGFPFRELEDWIQQKQKALRDFDKR